MSRSLLHGEDLRPPQSYREAVDAITSRAPRNAIALQACRDILTRYRPAPKDNAPLSLGVMP